MPPPPRKRLIEFVGDSLTVGYATIANGAPKWSTSTEDPTKTYAERIANTFDADYSIIAISGRGIARNASGDRDKLLPAIYTMLDLYNNPDVPYDFSVQPDLIIINIGTNDENSKNMDMTPADFAAEVEAFLKMIRSNNPNAYIIYGYGMLRNRFFDTIRDTIESLRAAGDEKIAFVAFERFQREDLIFGHPMAHAYVPLGERLIEGIKRLTNW